MINTLIAIGLMYAGFVLFALIYFLRTNQWNGFANKQKIIAAALVQVILCVLLVNVPDISDVLKLITGLEVNIEKSMTGFLTIGFTLSGVVSSKLKNPEEKAKLEQLKAENEALKSTNKN